MAQYYGKEAQKKKKYSGNANIRKSVNINKIQISVSIF